MSSQSRQQIPGTNVLNWQSPSKKRVKPSIRRPMTACEACRSAKVKCNRQETCERCKNRGLICSYGPALNSNNEICHRPSRRKRSVGDRPTSSKSPSTSHAIPTTSLSTTQNQSDPMSVYLTGNLFNLPDSNPEMLPFPQTNSGLEQWGEETFNHALEEFDWVFPGSDLSLKVSFSRSLPWIGNNMKTSSQSKIPIRIVLTIYNLQPRKPAPWQAQNATLHTSKRRQILQQCLRKDHSHHIIASVAQRWWCIFQISRLQSKNSRSRI